MGIASNKKNSRKEQVCENMPCPGTQTRHPVWSNRLFSHTRALLAVHVCRYTHHYHHTGFRSSRTYSPATAFCPSESKASWVLTEFIYVHCRWCPELQGVRGDRVPRLLTVPTISTLDARFRAQEKVQSDGNMTKTPALRELRQGDCEFDTSLGYIVTPYLERESTGWRWRGEITEPGQQCAQGMWGIEWQPHTHTPFKSTYSLEGTALFDHFKIK